MICFVGCRVTWINPMPGNGKSFSFFPSLIEFVSLFGLYCTSIFVTCHKIYNANSFFFDRLFYRQNSRPECTHFHMHKYKHNHTPSPFDYHKYTRRYRYILLHIDFLDIVTSWSNEKTLICSILIRMEEFDQSHMVPTVSFCGIYSLFCVSSIRWRNQM